MKYLILSAAFLVPAFSHATIDIASRVTIADSQDVEATDLTQMLKTLGVKTYINSLGHESISLKGQITESHVRCDNGNNSYSVNLVVLDDKANEIQKIDLDGSSQCDSPSDAEKLNQVMNKWGGFKLEGNCGTGHCWRFINSIKCTHFPPAQGHEFDSCMVELSSDGAL